MFPILQTKVRISGMAGGKASLPVINGKSFVFQLIVSLEGAVEN
jgi:hypothetical protein